MQETLNKTSSTRFCQSIPKVKILMVETTRREAVTGPSETTRLDSKEYDIVRSLWRHKEVSRNDLSCINTVTNKTCSAKLLGYGRVLRQSIIGDI